MPTSVPYDYHGIRFPLNPDDVLVLKQNFGQLTNYGDGTHDGNDITVRDGKIPVYAVDAGTIARYKHPNEDIGIGVLLLLGRNASGRVVYANYVHMDEALPAGSKVKRGGIIGYISKPHDGSKHLHFEIRIGDKPRFETSSDATPGDEVDVTDILVRVYTRK